MGVRQWLFVSKGGFRLQTERRRPVPSNVCARSRMWFRSGNFFAALIEIIVGDGLQVVDIVKVDILQEIHFRIDIAGHGDTINSSALPRCSISGASLALSRT